MKIKFNITLPLLLLFTACNSVQKYNETIVVKHSVEEMKEDVEEAYIQFQKFQPQLYQYISKEELDYSFDSLKNSFTHPLNSKEFAYALAAVVKKIGQAHNSVKIPNKRFTKKERKHNKKMVLDFHKLYFDIAYDTIFVEHNLSEDSLLTNAQVLQIDGIPVHQLIQRYKQYLTSDGYNQTFQPKIISQRLGTFYSYEKGRLDSIDVTFQNKDSIWTQTFKRYSKQDKKTEEKIDSVHEELKDINHSSTTSSQKKLTKAEKKEQKKKRKELSKYRNNRGYDATSKRYNRQFTFIGKDSTIGYLKIRRFTAGNYTDFYEEVFDKIDSAHTQNLIIDLRSNTGGRLNEIKELYSYLTNEKYQFLNPSQVSKRGSFYRTLYSHTGLISGFFLTLASPIVYPYTLLKTEKDSQGKIYYKLSESKWKNAKDKPFMGNIYVLINGSSFSASSTLSTALSKRENTLFIGEEAGGDFNGTVAGMHKRKQLPHTKVEIYLGIFYIDSPIKRELKGRGKFPDVELQTTYQQAKNGIDAEIEWILNDIEQAQNPK